MPLLLPSFRATALVALLALSAVVAPSAVWAQPASPAKAPAPATAAAPAAKPGALAEEAEIRKTLAQRIPGLKIDEVRRTPISGLFELRMGTDILYSDAKGEFLVQGALIESKTRTDLTQARIDKLLTIDFASLPLRDAVLVKQGNGARKLVVFGDPNCGYCKRLERDLVALKDVSIYTYLYPILGPDSADKSRDIWCAKDPGKAWRAWMVDGQEPPKAPAGCDTAALERNVEMGKRHKVTGTPALVFEDGSRVPGAIPAAQIDTRINSARKG